jgi:uncharacterized protein (DUF1015 family)
MSKILMSLDMDGSSSQNSKFYKNRIINQGKKIKFSMYKRNMKDEKIALEIIEVPKVNPYRNLRILDSPR